MFRRAGYRALYDRNLGYYIEGVEANYPAKPKRLARFCAWLRRAFELPAGGE